MKKRQIHLKWEYYVRNGSKYKKTVLPMSDSGEWIINIFVHFLYCLHFIFIAFILIHSSSKLACYSYSVYLPCMEYLTKYVIISFRINDHFKVSSLNLCKRFRLPCLTQTRRHYTFYILSH